MRFLFRFTPVSLRGPPAPRKGALSVPKEREFSPPLPSLVLDCLDIELRSGMLCSLMVTDSGRRNTYIHTSAPGQRDNAMVMRRVRGMVQVSESPHTLKLLCYPLIWVYILRLRYQLFTLVSSVQNDLLQPPLPKLSNNL
jgi:hypothetical protein